MKIAYFDCIAGASGDMLLGALLDAGLEEATLRHRLALLHLDDFDFQVRRVDKHGFSAIKVDVLVKDDVPTRHLPDIEAIVNGSDLPSSIKTQATAIFRRLGAVEAKIHGTTLNEVHLHELGGVDTIVDVVGMLCGLEELGIGQIMVSPLPMGRGFVRGAHGRIPLPAPATLALLKDTPIVGVDIDMELVTPTGAVLLSTLATGFGPIPAMTLKAIGYGAGGRDLEIPNLVRVLIGEASAGNHAVVETLTILETNIDDLNPEIYDYTISRLFDAGALDVTLSPLQMKKNRPATLLRVLCPSGHSETLKAILFVETSTLGIREQTVTRHSLPRTIQTVETPYGPVRMKVATLSDGSIKAAPEYEDCRRLAKETGLSLRHIYQAAQDTFTNQSQSAYL